MEVEKGCSTPKEQEFKIPAAVECPPPPRKKKERRERKTEPSLSEYFQSPELEKFFAAGDAPSRQT
ncbi:hypothetical protein C2S52_022715 [Perilla frutescens var. hirtella]|uniref:Uncharacterized protein n=1 Tax=Perilla frutescens var. hirtella TaxID=608512 RepID=A0AAD4P2T5_PERFH|nr:hypothetical protein C2S52_022715 [Perilla frutescens var. hirtella]KAH6806927.1 hypothetical protein C2S51_028035 [Perilla frutescens var. frutescens]KAH6824828.1 hypothetical protein C2S53_010903 [Perilla frutescens var. hirtella]